MQPILMLAIVAVAAIALGTGFLNNDVKLWIQDFGVGAGNIELPLDHALIDFGIIQVADGNFFKNVMNKCIVTPDVQIGGVFGEDPAVMSKDKQSQVTCKITGKNADWSPNHKVLTEGTVCAEFFPAGVPIMVPLGVTTNCPTGTVPIPNNPTQIDPKTAGDVILLVHANTYTMTP